MSKELLKTMKKQNNYHSYFCNSIVGNNKCDCEYKNNPEWQDKIRSICTFHGDEGTSGYLLSEDRFYKIFTLIRDELDKAYVRGRKSEKLLKQSIKNSIW